ncbi:MAG: VapC toxin family PIN domain ribonuclease [Desulfobacteraceae bacterium IS3]|nr:MAG: VapC toxin family PIN domain ribonuclease [Desulfobacteraceae bacterium IS3]
MNYLLDTNICIAFFKNDQKVVSKIQEKGMEKLVLCTPVKAELWYGACKSERVAVNQVLLREFFAQLPSLAFDDKTIENYGEIRAWLAKAGTPIGSNDLLIAAIAKTFRITVVTHNIKEFSRIPELLFEDWLDR